MQCPLGRACIMLHCAARGITSILWQMESSIKDVLMEDSSRGQMSFVIVSYFIFRFMTSRQTLTSVTDSFFSRSENYHILSWWKLKTSYVLACYRECLISGFIGTISHSYQIIAWGLHSDRISYLFLCFLCFQSHKWTHFITERWNWSGL